MTPEEVKDITEALINGLKTEAVSNSPIYVIISIVVTATPFALRYFKRVFVKEIEKVVGKHMAQMDDMFRIMEMHIEELKYVKIEQEDIKEAQEEIKKDVKKNTTFIEKLKEKC